MEKFWAGFEKTAVSVGLATRAMASRGLRTNKSAPGEYARMLRSGGVDVKKFIRSNKAMKEEANRLGVLVGTDRMLEQPVRSLLKEPHSSWKSVKDIRSFTKGSK